MIYFFIPLCLIFVYFFLITPRIPKRKRINTYLDQNYAHRGLFCNSSQAPENSMPAFQRAVQEGYGIELDIQLTKDNRLVVFHDSTLSRMCGIDINVREKTYQELCNLTLLHTNCKIPLLSEVLQMVDGQVPLLIEIKLPILSTLTCRLANELLKDYKGAYCIESFNTIALVWYRFHRPDIVRGQLSGNLTRENDGNNLFLCFLVKYLLVNALARPDFISFCYKDTANVSFYLNRHLFRVPTFAWTIDNPRTYQACHKNFDSYIFEGFLPKFERNA